MILFVLSPIRRRILAIASSWIACAIFVGATHFTMLGATIASPQEAYPSIRQDLNAGRANDAISLLQEQLSFDSSDATAHHLLCRVYLQEERWTDAERECERSVQLAPNDSNYHLWLGRAYGYDAAHASLRRAYALAKKVRAEFEAAVRLDPRNASALSDLGEFDVEVPRLIGGGLDRAQQIAGQLAPLDAVRWHELRAKIAYKRSNFADAEHEWKQAIQSSPHPAEQWMGLAAFYARRKNFPAMQQAIASGAASISIHAAALVQGASLLIENRQDLHQAQQMLRQYLASSQKSEDAPAFQVHRQLGNLLASQGDSAGAQREFAAASSLASTYAPTQQANGD